MPQLLLIAAAGIALWAGYKVVKREMRRVGEAIREEAEKEAVAELEEVARGLPGDEAIGELAALGFTTLVIHGLDESRPAVMRWLLELETRRGGPLELVRKTPHAAAFAILPAQ